MVGVRDVTCDSVIITRDLAVIRITQQVNHNVTKLQIEQRDRIKS